MAYKTKNGRRFSMTRSATNGRQRLVKMEGTKLTFECENGHRNTHDYGKGPVSRRVGERFLEKMAAYWGLGLQSNGTKGFVYGWCQKCQNIADGVKP